MEQLDLEQAHKHSINNKNEIEKSNTCGCFYCREMFAPSEIKIWIKDERGETAQCPYCLVDSVIGDASKIELNIKLLEMLNKKYFK